MNWFRFSFLISRYTPFWKLFSKRVLRNQSIRRIHQIGSQSFSFYKKDLRRHDWVNFIAVMRSCLKSHQLYMGIVVACGWKTETSLNGWDRPWMDVAGHGDRIHPPFSEWSSISSLWKLRRDEFLKVDSKEWNR